MSPRTYQEWATTLLASGASIEIDATKILREDAEKLAIQAANTTAGIAVTFYNCQNIPFDLRATASLGRGRVKFRL